MQKRKSNTKRTEKLGSLQLEPDKLFLQQFNFFITSTRLNWIHTIQRFCNIFVIWSTIWLLWVLFLRSQRGQLSLDCDMPSLPDILWMLLFESKSLAWGTATESSVFSQLDLNWSLRSLKPERNFLNHLLYILRSSMLSPFIQQMLLVTFAAVKSSSNS